MSTRSGKRIHASDQENIDKVDPEVVLKSERKTRSRKIKENYNLGVTVTKHKRNNYVAYPTDDEGIKDPEPSVSDEPLEVKPQRKIKRYTLKEPNIIVDEIPENKPRQTRRTKRFAENIEPDVEKVEVPSGSGKKSKKNKKKKSKDHEQATDIEQEIKVGLVENVEIPVIKSKKKKKGKRKQSNEKQLNKSNTSVDSFHSAAGSPMNISHENIIIKESTPLQNGSATSHEDTNLETSTKSDKHIKMTQKQSIVNDSVDNLPKELNTTFDKEEPATKLNNSQRIQNKRKSSIMNVVAENVLQLNTTFEKETTQIDTTFEKEAEPQNKRKKSLMNGTFEKNTNTSQKLNTTFKKDEVIRKSGRRSSIANVSDVKLNSTFDKPSNDSKNLNTTFEKTESRVRRSTFDKPKESVNITIGKNTTDETVSLNSTYDKETKKTLDSTFEKNKSNSAKSSLLTSDSSANATFDKTNTSRISITSDDSRTENIINQTPVLIESSMDESMESTNSTEKSNDIPQLVREGTFTKDTSETASPKLKLSVERTPTKRFSLPSPGCTPFPNRSTQKTEKTILNVTRSIEKNRRPSLVEPRQARVMFCSPANNPVLNTQQKTKIIKSSMKGSNKSFVFEESGSTTRPISRKRSLTLNDADNTKAKRKRLADDMQQSVDRLSRPRTSSAAAKLTTTAHNPTPKNDSVRQKRTKLPNFAALHRREFDKMESLTDCQKRKAKRAKQLLTPNGGVNVLERTSTGSTGSSSKESVKEQPKNKKEPKKLELKPFTPKLPTLESLRPGYTRFGFKMNSDVNPFSFGSVTEIKPRENKPNGSKIVKAIKPLPSLTGMTSRKEMAKQTIMREKSFTSLSSKRETKRTENRTVIKGVRTNRRFELQMKMRNVD